MEDKHKKLIQIVPILTMLILLVIGTTYAYYVVSSTNNTSISIFDVNNKPLGAVTFSSKVSSLKMKITPTDMAIGNIGNKYYAVTPDVLEDRGSLFKRKAQNHEIIRGTVAGTTTDERYICEGTLKIEVSNTMYKVLQWGDVKLILTASNAKINKKDRLTLDISDIKNGIQTYPVKFVTNKGSDTTITADVVMENRDVDQTKIADTMLDINITLEERPSCHIEVEEENISEPISLGMHCDGENNMKTCMENAADYIKEVKNMTSTEVGGMYRYQGEDDVNNWICFGTNDKSKCISNIDKYMYRIMGVTRDGQLVLIKESGVKEGEVTDFQWHYNTWVSDCGGDGSTCSWPSSRIFKRLNGLCNADAGNCPGVNPGTSGDTNIFIGNSYYEYLQDNEWLYKIADHLWTYGDTEIYGNYNGDEEYAVKAEFKDSITAKIGLQYMYDYYYAYEGGNPGNETNAKKAWIHLSKDNSTNITSEWLMTRNKEDSILIAWYIYEFGYVNKNDLGYGHGARPVFYLNSNIRISNSEGSKEDPFIIKN